MELQSVYIILLDNNLSLNHVSAISGWEKVRLTCLSCLNHVSATSGWEKVRLRWPRSSPARLLM